MKWIALTLVAFVSACTVEEPTSLPEVDVTQEPTEKFSLHLREFKDARTPRAQASDVSQDIMYEYNPEKLMSGVSYRMPLLLKKHFNTNPDVQPAYKTEIHLKKLRQYIETGNLFTGGFGEYVTRLEIYSIARRGDGSVLWEGPVDVEISTGRNSYQGRAPSAELDRQKMFDLTERAIRTASQRVLRKIHGAHNAEYGLNLF